ncbi:DUF4136 domain-containing protein [Thalassotalea euphylliae]|uniref:DUF4136 domain-containing protein n=1 Tax=Thalassotalea euphylliae TaxID=1655234 RepID=UPI003627E934
MNKSRLFSIVALFSIIVGCASTSAPKVDFDKNEQVNTSQYKTFAWLKETKILAAPADMNPVMKIRIDDAIEAAFTAKGYQLVDAPEKADFAISYTVGSRDKIKVDSFPTAYRTGFGWGHGYYGPHYGVAYGTETRVRSYTEGKLAVDVFDVASKQPAWHGVAVKRVRESDKEDPKATIKLIVDSVVSQFY